MLYHHRIRKTWSTTNFTCHSSAARSKHIRTLFGCGCSTFEFDTGLQTLSAELHHFLLPWKRSLTNPHIISLTPMRFSPTTPQLSSQVRRRASHPEIVYMRATSRQLERLSPMERTAYFLYGPQPTSHLADARTMT